MVEYAVRNRIGTHWGWYESVEVDASSSIGAIFIGSSRVGASIHAGTFAKVADFAPAERVLNMGRGYSRLIQHYLGLRNVLDSDPKCLLGTIVFLEAPTGVPDHSTFADSWEFGEAPQQLTMQLQASDLPTMWRHQGSRAFKPTFEFLTGPSRALIYRDWIRRLLRRRITGRLKDLALGVTMSDGASADLAGASGVRTDRIGIGLVRQKMIADAKNSSREACALYADTVLTRLVDLVSEAGGEVVLFDIPLSTQARKRYGQVISQLDRERFVDELSKADIAMLQPDFEHNDSDFPDLSHLRKSRQAEFTRALACSWLKQRSSSR